MLIVDPSRPQGAIADEQALPEPTPSPTLPDIIGAAFQEENAVVNAIDYLRRPVYKADPQFDLLNWMGDRSDVLLNHRDRFVGVESADEADAVLARIESQTKRRELLASGGFAGILAGVAAGSMDPTILIPGIAYAKGARAVRAASLAAGTAAVTGGATAAQELVLQANQELRTREDAVINTLAATMVGGVLGGAVGLVTRGEVDQIAAKVVGGMGDTPGVSAGSLSAAAIDTVSEGTKGAFGLEKVTKHIGPVTRQINNPDFATARGLMPKLADAGETMAENALGVPTGVSREGGGGTIENRAKYWYRGEIEALPELDNLYATYWYDGNAPAKLAGLRAKAGAEFARYTGSLNGKYTSKEFREQVTLAMRSGDEHPVPQVAQAAKMIRQKVFKPIFDEAVKVKMPGFKEDMATVGDDTYAPRVYLQEKIAARPDGFVQALTDHFARLTREEWIADLAKHAEAGDDVKSELFEKWRERGVDFDFASNRFDPGAYAKELANEVTADILGSNPMRLADVDIVTGPKGVEKARMLSIPSRAIQDYLENDIERLSRIYTRTMSSDVELMREFGSLTLDKEFKALREELETLREGKGEREATRLNNQYEASKRDMLAVLQRLRHQYALPNDPQGIGHRLANTIVSLNYLRLMGGVTLSALPDLARPIMRHGLTSAFRDGFIPFVRGMQQYKLGARETKLAGTAGDLVLNTRTQALADLQEGWMRGTKFERGLEWTTNKFGMVNLMSPWNVALKQIAGTITIANLTRAAERVNAGTATPRDIEALAANGIDQAMAGRIWRQLSEVENGGQRIDGEWWPNSEAWTDDGARRAMAAAIVREVDNMIVTPGVEKPLWTSRLLGSPEIGRILGQFRSFGMASTSKMLIAGVQQRDAAFLNGLLLSVALGGLSVYAKSNIAGGRSKEEMEKGGPAWWATNAVDASGILAVIGDANRILERTPVGGLSNLTGEQISKTQAGDVFSAGVGPTADLALRAVRGTFGSFTRDESGDLDWSPTQTNVHDMRMMLPGQNIPYGIRQAFDAVEDGFNDAFGIPKRRQQ